jgi:hypothetical protein
MAAVIASLVAGLGSLLVSYYSRASDEAGYANAINLADAGVNYELRRINANVSNADMPGSSAPYGTYVTFGNGSFRVYCTMSDGVTAWDKASTPFCILATGTSGSESRTVKISATSPAAPGGTASIFAITSGVNSSSTISGSISTDGSLQFNGGAVVTGGINLDGPSAVLTKAPSTAYTETINPTAVTWPTVSATALSHFPNSGATAPGGLTYLSLHNDNLTAVPPILLNSLNLSGGASMTLVGKPGGANYYVTTLSVTGGSTLTFNNTLGPINIWEASTTNSVTISGGTAAVKMTTDPTKPVIFYLATTKGVTLSGGSELDAGIYNPDTGDTVTISGGASDYSQVVCDNLSFTGGSTFNGTAGYFSALVAGTYVFNGSWQEINGI